HWTSSGSSDPSLAAVNSARRAWTSARSTVTERGALIPIRTRSLRVDRMTTRMAPAITISSPMRRVRTSMMNPPWSGSETGDIQAASEQGVKREGAGHLLSQWALEHLDRRTGAGLRRGEADQARPGTRQDISQAVALDVRRTHSHSAREVAVR